MQCRTRRECLVVSAGRGEVFKERATCRCFPREIVGGRLVVHELGRLVAGWVASSEGTDEDAASLDGNED
jgi:hypothetical protein